MMTDYQLIKNLIARYGQVSDSVPRSPQAFADCFTEDGAFTINGSTVTSRSKIIKLVEAGNAFDANKPLMSGTTHIQFNSVINITGDEATSSTQYIILELNEQGWRIRNSGLYDDVIVRDVDGQWRFKSRESKWFKGIGQDPVNPHAIDMVKPLFEAIMASD